MRTTAEPTAAELTGLVSNGRVNRRLYTDPEVFDLEMRRIFGRAWIYVGHASQLREAGDFITTRIGRDRIIVTHHSDGKLHAFYNRCAHRGAEVCPQPAGNAQLFTCPYHAWAYRTDGSLDSVPLADGYGADFAARRDDLGLERVARLDSYRGFIFASQSDHGASLEAFLGPDVCAAFDNFVDRSPNGEVSVMGGKTVQQFHANWKLQIENSIDLLHPNVLHHNAVNSAVRLGTDAVSDSSAIEIAITLSNGLAISQWDDMQTAALPRGHCWMGGFINDVSKEEKPQDGPAWQQTYRSALAHRHGESKAEEILNFSRHNTIVYPNLFVNAQLSQVHVLHPVAVDRTEQHGYAFKLGGAPDEMFHAAVRALNLVNSPASIITTDDHEVFERMQQSMTFGEREWIDWTRGFDGEQVGDDAIEAQGTNEILMRNQHNAWIDYMTEAS